MGRQACLWKIPFAVSTDVRRLILTVGGAIPWAVKAEWQAAWAHLSDGGYGAISCFKLPLP